MGLADECTRYMQSIAVLFTAIYYVMSTSFIHFSHIIGGTIGATTGTVLTGASLFSVQTRCAMLLVIPR